MKKITIAFFFVFVCGRVLLAHNDSVEPHRHSQNIDGVIAKRIDEYKLLLSFDSPDGAMGRLCPTITINVNQKSAGLFLNKRAFSSNVGVRARITFDSVDIRLGDARMYTRSSIPAFGLSDKMLIPFGESRQYSICGHMAALEEGISDLINKSENLEAEDIREIKVWFVFDDLLTFDPDFTGIPRLSFYTNKYTLKGEVLDLFLSKIF